MLVLGGIGFVYRPRSVCYLGGLGKSQLCNFEIFYLNEAASTEQTRTEKIC